jgi:hypothetical protein
MRGHFAILSLGVALTTLGGAGVAQADPPGPDALPIHVISVKTDDVDDQAEAMTQAMKAEVRKLKGWSLGEGDYSLEVLSLALKCPSPPDAACEARIAEHIKATRFVWGNIKRAPGRRVAGTLHLWTREQGQTKTDVSFSDNLTEPNDESLRKVVNDALVALTGGPPKGTVKITAGDVNGQVLVDGQSSGTIKDGQATIFVSVGTHKIEVRAPGYAAATGDVSVRPNSSVGLTLTPQTEEQARNASSSPSMKKMAGYGALILGAGFGAVGIYSSLQVNSINTSDEMKAWRGGTFGDVCTNARDNPTAGPFGGADAATISSKCDKSSTFGALQWVFYGLGAISAGTGAYLLMTDKPKSDAAPATGSVRVLPHVRPTGGGGVDLLMTF